MTERQQIILKFLKQRQTRELPPPTIREIGDACDISSTSVVSYNVEQLVKAGLVTWHRETARGIVLRDPKAPADLVAENARLVRELKVTQLQVKALRQQVAALRGEAVS